MATPVAGALLELNALFTAWVESVYHHQVHSETGNTRPHPGAGHRHRYLQLVADAHQQQVITDDRIGLRLPARDYLDLRQAQFSLTDKAFSPSCPTCRTNFRETRRLEEVAATAQVRSWNSGGGPST